jgi:hypothetical protein
MRLPGSAFNHADGHTVPCSVPFEIETRGAKKAKMERAAQNLENGTKISFVAQRRTKLWLSKFNSSPLLLSPTNGMLAIKTQSGSVSCVCVTGCFHQQTGCSPSNRNGYRPIKWLNKPNSSSPVSENFEGGSRSLLSSLL